MACLARHWTPVGLDDLVRAASTVCIPERAVAVTFDDGYLDALTMASPILQAFGIPATFFVNSDRLYEPHERWWDILERLFLTDRELPPELDIRTDRCHLRAPTRTAADRSHALDLINQTMWALGAEDRESIVSSVIRWSGGAVCLRGSHRVLTAEELRELGARPGHGIGAHTVHHLALSTQGHQTKQAEVIDDKSALEKALGRPVSLFSYPYGDFDAELVSVVRDAGFRAAFTVEAGSVSASTNRLLLPRCEITARQHHDFPRFLEAIATST